MLSDAAKRLGVSADELESALAKAEDAQLDKAVKAGDLTKEQADAIKRQRKELRPRARTSRRPARRTGPRGSPRPRLRPARLRRPRRRARRGGRRARHLRAESCISQLRDGKTLAQLAKAHDKSLADLKSAAKDVLSKRLDAAVKQGHLTRDEADEILQRLPDMIDHLGERGPVAGPRGFGPPPGDPEGFGPPPRWQ